MLTAIFVDGIFFRDKYKDVRDSHEFKDRSLSENLIYYLSKHLREDAEKDSSPADDLYNIYYYDIPYNKLVIKYSEGISGKAEILQTKEIERFFDIISKRSDIRYKQMNSDNFKAEYRIKESSLKELLKNSHYQLNEKDFYLWIDKVGLHYSLSSDLAKVVFQNVVDRIVIISEEFELLPLIKIADDRGIHVVLDSLTVDFSDNEIRTLNECCTYRRLEPFVENK